MLLLVAGLAGNGDASSLIAQVALSSSAFQLIFPPEFSLLDRP